MVLTAADRAFARSAPTLLADIKLFAQRVGKLSARRNDIAHGVVWEFWANDKDLGRYLIPAPYNTRRHMTHLQYNEAVSKLSIEELINDPFSFGPNKYAYTARQIDEYGKHFAIYTNAMIDLVAVVKETCDALFP